MPDNLNIRQPADGTKINVNEDWEVRYWTKELGVTEAKLREAVKAVGTSVANVKKILEKIILCLTKSHLVGGFFNA